MRSLCLALFITTALVPASHAMAAVYHVAPGGSDADDGSAGAPWATLGHAADSVGPGDEVIVEDGSYEGFQLSTSGAPGARIVFRAMGGGAVIDADGPTGDGIRLQNVSHAFTPDGDATMLDLAAWLGLGYDHGSFVATPAELFVSDTDPRLRAGATADGGYGCDVPGGGREHPSGWALVLLLLCAVARGKRCRRDDHLWVAEFLASGPLARWRCSACGQSDRELPPRARLAEKDYYGGRAPDRPTGRGPTPPASARRWSTPDGGVLVEGEPTGTDYLGTPIPGLESAHAYALVDDAGKVIERYEAAQVRTSRFGTDVCLTRYEVVEGRLVRFTLHGHEESSFDIPVLGRLRSEVVLSGLEPATGTVSG